MPFVHALFFVVFCLIGLVNHYFLRSAALDYGIANQAMYLIANGEAPYITMLLGEQQTYHYLGLHVSFWVPLFAPLYWVFGSYTLLLVQNIALVFGGIGIVNLAKRMGFTQSEPYLILLAYYLFFGIYTALAVEYHDNVIGASFLPWLVLFYLEGDLLLAAMCVLGILISKENMGLWLMAIAPALFLLQRPMRLKQIWFPLTVFIVSGLWFYACAYFIMPYYNPQGKFEQVNRFSHMGKNVTEVIQYILADPIRSLELFYKSHVQPDSDEIIKHEFILAILLSGAWALLVQPAFLLMALPLLMQKLWNKETAFWGVNYHYQVEFAALLAIAVLFALKPLKGKWRTGLLMVNMVLVGLSTFSLIKERKAYQNQVKENIFLSSHYLSKLGIERIHKKLNDLPPEYRITAQSNLLPHLSNRTHAFHFPYLLESNMLVMTRQETAYYPLGEEEGKAFIDSLLWKARWKADTSNKDLLILFRPN